MKNNINDIIETYLKAIEFVQKEIGALESRKITELKTLTESSTNIIRELDCAKEMFQSEPLIAETYDEADKKTLSELCLSLEDLLKRKMELLEQAKFVNDALLDHIHEILSSRNTGYKSKKSSIPIVINEEM